jgi:hypothetical protein
MVNGIWGSSATDVWFAGGLGLVRWDGTAWSQAGPSAFLYAAWGSGATDVWAVGMYGTLLHYRE